MAEQISGYSKHRRWAWVHVIFSTLWCASQLSISNDGSHLFSHSPIELLKDNEAVQWIAFVSVFVQAASFPRDERMNSWFSWRRKP